MAYRAIMLDDSDFRFESLAPAGFRDVGMWLNRVGLKAVVEDLSKVLALGKAYGKQVWKVDFDKPTAGPRTPSVARKAARDSGTSDAAMSFWFEGKAG